MICHLILGIFVMLFKASISFVVKKDSIKMIVEVISNGATRPQIDLPDVEWTSLYAPGQLTDVGKRQMYNLGLQVAKQYPYIFSRHKHFDYKLMSAHSLYLKKCLVAANSHVIGLVNTFDDKQLPFANDDPLTHPPQKLEFNVKELNFRTALPHGFRPFAVFSRHPDQQHDLWNHNSSCKANEQSRDNTVDILERRMNSNVGLEQEVTKAAKLLPGLFEAISNMNISLLQRSSLVADALLNDHYNAPKTPVVQENTPLFSKLLYWLSLDAQLHYPNLKSSRLALTPFYHNLLKTFNKKINPKIAKDKKGRILEILLHSVDTNVMMGHLNVIGLSSLNCVVDLVEGSEHLPDKCYLAPRPASNLIYELIQDDKYGVFIRLRYNGKYIDVCSVQETHGKGFLCPLEDFEELVNSKFIVDKHDEKCQIKPSFSSKLFTWRMLKQIGLGIIVILWIVLSMSIVSYWAETRQLKKLFNRKMEEVD